VTGQRPTPIVERRAGTALDSPFELRPFAPIPGHRYGATAAPGDVFRHIRSDRADLCFELATRLLARLDGTITAVNRRLGGGRSSSERHSVSRPWTKCHTAGDSPSVRPRAGHDGRLVASQPLLGVARVGPNPSAGGRRTPSNRSAVRPLGAATRVSAARTAGWARVGGTARRAHRGFRPTIQSSWSTFGRRAGSL
jgi:hypothetical protein